MVGPGFEEYGLVGLELDADEMEADAELEMEMDMEALEDEVGSASQVKLTLDPASFGQGKEEEAFSCSKISISPCTPRRGAYIWPRGMKLDLDSRQGDTESCIATVGIIQAAFERGAV